jgi:hypothetical protein
MRSFWSDPYLWVHLTGVAALPIFLEICLLGLAVGNPFLPAWLELLFVAAIGITPVLWMQWQRPFCIYSLVILALQPSELTEDQRRILRLFKAPTGRVVAIGVAVALVGVLWQIYRIAPIATEAASLLPIGRLGGLLLAAIAFMAANLFLQVPASVLRAMLVSDATVAATEPYPSDRILSDFTLFGIRVKQILPPIRAVPAQPAVAPVAAPEPATTGTPDQSTVEETAEDTEQDADDEIAAGAIGVESAIEGIAAAVGEVAKAPDEAAEAEASEAIEEAVEAIEAAIAEEMQDTVAEPIEDLEDESAAAIEAAPFAAPDSPEGLPEPTIIEPPDANADVAVEVAVERVEIVEITADDDEWQDEFDEDFEEEIVEVVTTIEPDGESESAAIVTDITSEPSEEEIEASEPSASEAGLAESPPAEANFSQTDSAELDVAEADSADSTSSDAAPDSPGHEPPADLN